MNEKTLQTLEFNKIITMLAEKAVSKRGKERALALKPSRNLNEITGWQKSTSEAVGVIVKNGALPLGGLQDVSSSLSRAALGGVLSIEELLHMGDFLYVCRKMAGYGQGINNSLTELFDSIAQAPDVEKEITRCILGADLLADDASPQLASIRRDIKVSNSRIKDKLNNMIHSSALKNVLQDAVITIRADRYCIPVKYEQRHSVKGMVHDQSSSGATVFIEPIAVVELNNKIKELEYQEKEEMYKILKELSMAVAMHEPMLSANLGVLTELDFIFAKGELSLSMNGTEPVFNNRGHIDIKKGRHPLLSAGTVVPIDIFLGKDFKTLLITGPNTGGKTVSLKTLGLFTCMGQAGLHIAAYDKSELAVFDDVFADIGDEQSIEQSLSTFSSHMTNIVSILNSLGNNALVLLDELGAGTDPTEGAALAIAILQFLQKRQIHTVVTTHYSELKVYALGAAGVENASCEFDIQTLKPTYKLLIGIPGKSNAFAISHKLGLPEHIIGSAKEILSQEDARFEDVITDLEISKKTVLLEQDKAEEYRREAEMLKKELQRQKEKLSKQREKIIESAKEDARRLLHDTKEQADQLMKELQQQIKEASHKGADSVRTRIREAHQSLESSPHRPAKERLPLSRPLVKGDGVFIHSLGQRGVVSAPPDSGGEAVIQAGIMKIKAHVSDLSLDEHEGAVQIQGKKVSQHIKTGKSQTITSEIDLRGHTIEEGLEKTDKYLDDAFLSGLSQVTIIHGKGTGALRAGIHQYLKKHHHVKTYRLGSYGEGDSGVTIVELRK